ncbi:MAG: transglycosylase domain-containing protein, partial [Desulfuromonadales bacterium]|nr:transglycosylase domain-containing protein [Desulfuromonadales bacterium]
DPEGLRKVQLRDRAGAPLTITYHNGWNYHDVAPLHAFPALLKDAFIASEDQRFYRHSGVDWLARLHATWQNLTRLSAVRGASTISEQTVRMLYPRPRTLWSRWLEGWEAYRLEQAFSKADILSFYLNQVPFEANRRGVIQAARRYFGRDLDTLNEAELLALAVAVRAPSHYRPGANPVVNQRVTQLAQRMFKAGKLTQRQLEAVKGGQLHVGEDELELEAAHFARWLTRQERQDESQTLETSLDSALQAFGQTLLQTRLQNLQASRVSAGAMLVADHQSGEILAWVNARADAQQSGDGEIDAVLAPRQPGSALKPFVYALALEDGWSAATLLKDAPLASAVGSGSHAYRNYSRLHYGPLRLRDCLGNSLNIPAILAAQKVGPKRLLESLQRVGLRSLNQDADTYGLGLALGNGEAPLLEMVTAYAALARGGVYRPLHATTRDIGDIAPVGQRVFSEESASVIADILADPSARALEFGRNSILNLAHPVAVKTGTSTDYRDAWAIGFDHRFVVGVWLGNLDNSSMHNITGASGPALVLRSVFAELAQQVAPRALALSPRLQQRVICLESGGVASANCPTRSEWFAPGYQLEPCSLNHAGHEEAAITAVAATSERLRLLQPSDGLLLAKDPRIPDALEYFAFKLPQDVQPQRTEWLVDGVVAAVTGSGESEWLWPVAAGAHTAAARVWVDGEEEGVLSAESRFVVRGR